MKWSHPNLLNLGFLGFAELLGVLRQDLTMQLLCNRAMFSTAFSVAASAVPSRTPKDVLRNVFMTVGANGVELIGTDQEVAIRYQVSGVTTGSAGEVLLPTQKVSSILR